VTRREAVLVLAIAGILAFAVPVIIDNLREQRACRARGGEAITVRGWISYRTICLKAGAVSDR